MTTLTTPNPALEEWSGALRDSHAPRLRSMRQFAEEEIVLPTGDFRRMKFKCSRQPFTRLWFDAIASGLWTRYWCTGPSQASKTLCGFVIPLLYHLFEIGETVILALPDLDMARDKWTTDILPAIEACPRYREYLPGKGPGSKGGQGTLVQFGNGAILKFMSGGGSDKSVAGFTSRVLMITEADGFGRSTTSLEADKIEQLRARLRSFGGGRSREYGECTLSIEEGRTHQEITNGSNSRIVLPCPHCGGWVVPEREHVHGWEDADDEIAAYDRTRFYCPACEAPWSDEERAVANAGCRLVHRGQEIDTDGVVHGDPPRTKTLGFRWSAVHNLLRTSGDAGEDLWKAERAVDQEGAERKLCQFVFAVPYRAPDAEYTPLKPDELQRRIEAWKQNIVPKAAEFLTMGVDMGKREGYYTLIAWLPGARGHVVDYGKFEIESDKHGIERATLAALHALRAKVFGGWPREWAGAADDESTGWKGGTRVPDAVWIDAGWGPHTKVIYNFCRETASKNLFHPLVGRAEKAQFMRWRYDKPSKTGAEVRHIGEGYHLSWQRDARVMLVEVNVDHWKTWVHERLSTKATAPGSMMLFEGSARDHAIFTRHLCAERLVQTFDPKRGTIWAWECTDRQNHWLDSTVYASAAGHYVGVRLIGDRDEQAPVDTDYFKRQVRLGKP